MGTLPFDDKPPRATLDPRREGGRKPPARARNLYGAPVRLSGGARLRVYTQVDEEPLVCVVETTMPPAVGDGNAPAFDLRVRIVDDVPPAAKVPEEPTKG